MDANVPNPGSDEAIKQGCKCPVLDNAHGRGFPWPDENGKMINSFWINAGCPLHGGHDRERGRKYKFGGAMTDPLASDDFDRDWQIERQEMARMPEHPKPDLIQRIIEDYDNLVTATVCDGCMCEEPMCYDTDTAYCCLAAAIEANVGDEE